MASTATFNYPLIESSLGEIRVLNIQPGSEADSLTLTFVIIQIRDDSESDFEAISYRWGDLDGQHEITLNNESFLITDRMNRMIRDLRNAHEPRRVWIDALCINQKDIHERNHQVQLMRYIYSNARRVCIWLDYEIDETNAALQKLLTMDSGCEIQQLLEEETTFWSPICGIINEEYFQRLWVQQEMSNAKKLVLQCRRTAIPTTSLPHFVYAWERISYLCVLGRLAVDVNHPLSRVPNRALENVLTEGQNTFGSESMELVEILRNSKRLKCSEQHDIIYGVMFMAHDWQGNDIVVDYSLPVSEVFTQAMTSYLQVYSSVAFLEYVGSWVRDLENTEDRLPSWVPDWRIDGQETIHKPMTYGRNSTPKPAYISGNFLHTTGVKIADVSQYYGMYLNQGNVGNIPVVELFLTYFEILNQARYPDDMLGRVSRLVQLLTQGGFETFIFDYDNNSVDNIKLSKLFLSLSNHVFSESMADNLPEDVSLFFLKVILREKARGVGSHGEQALFGEMSELSYSIAFAELTGLTPFICQSGSIGLASPHTEPGDEVWLVPTCKNAIILRPYEGTHLVLGRAWLDNEKHWSHFGGVREYLVEGEVFGEYKVEALCLR